MSRLLGVVFIYAAMILAWSVVGVFMVIAPVRFGNLVHESLLIFPEVKPGDWGKKLAVRLLGLGLLAFAIRFTVRIIYLRD
jgi:hypothetical protein